MFLTRADKTPMMYMHKHWKRDTRTPRILLLIGTMSSENSFTEKRLHRGQSERTTTSQKSHQTLSGGSLTNTILPILSRGRRKGDPVRYTLWCGRVTHQHAVVVEQQGKKTPQVHSHMSTNVVNRSSSRGFPGDQ